MTYSIFLNSVTDFELIDIVKLCEDSSSRYDDSKISPLNTVLEYRARALPYICTLSLQEGIFLEESKIANVILLFKKDNAMVFKNYRPVSLLCTLPNLKQNIIRISILFQRKHSTQLALTFFMDKLIKSIENGNHVIGVYLDLPKLLVW